MKRCKPIDQRRAKLACIVLQLTRLCKRGCNELSGHGDDAKAYQQNDECKNLPTHGHGIDIAISHRRQCCHRPPQTVKDGAKLLGLGVAFKVKAPVFREKSRGFKSINVGRLKAEFRIEIHVVRVFVVGTAVEEQAVVVVVVAVGQAVAGKQVGPAQFED